MLLKIRDASTGKDNYVNPDSVDIVIPAAQPSGYFYVHMYGNPVLIIDSAGLQELLATTAPATAPAPAAAPKTTSAKITAMTRDQTKNSGSPMWRCATEAGFMVNVFKHDDQLKDTFHLLWQAGYGGIMEAMNLGDTITWTRDPVAVELVQNGSFWNVAAVALRPDAAMPDEPEPDEQDSAE